MKTICIANQKGGCGKTTSAALLCLGLTTKGKTVGVIDCDRLSPLFDWCRGSGLQAALPSLAWSPSELLKQIGDLSGQVDYLIIDMSGSSEVMNALAFGVSDLVLIPMQPSAIDARGARRTIGLANQVSENRRARIESRLVLTRVTLQVVDDAIRLSRQIAEKLGVPLLPLPIIERVAFRDMFSVVDGDQMQQSAARRLAEADAQKDIASLAEMVLEETH